MIALRNLRLKNRHGLIIAYLNINSIRNKIDFLRPMISESIDILIIAETKIDNTFPTSQFLIEGFMKPYRYDRSQNGGGLLIYARERAPVKELKQYKAPADIDCGVIEINLKKQKWLLATTYRPPTQSQQYFFTEDGKTLDHYCRAYENLILIGDFNCEIDDDVISDFVDNYNLASLVRSPTCFKSNNPRCIDLILTNRNRNFQSTVAIETGLSDFHLMIATVLKGGYVKRGPKIITYRDYSLFGILRTPPFVNHKGNDVNSDWLADQWDERSVLGLAQLHKGSMKGDDPTIDTAQTPKRFDWRLALLGKIPKTFTDSIPNKADLAA